MPDSNAKKLAQFLTSSGTYNLYDVQADSTGFFDLPDGTTAQRPTPTAGMIRFNSTINLAEYYDGTSWKAIDAPPTVSSISPSTSYTANEDITITGTNFVSGATVKFIGADATEYNSPSVTFTNSTTLVAQTPNTALTAGNEPYDVKVTNTSGLSGTLEDALDAGSTPAWSTGATLPGIYDSTRSSVSISLSASDPDGQTVTYAVKSGSALPSGLSLNTSTGAITGSTSAVGSNTTSTFTITASAGGDETDRTFSLTQYAPVVTSYTSTGSGSFTVPSGVTAVDVLVVAGGGGGAGTQSGNAAGSGGGAGGLIYRPAFPVTPGGSISYSVGAGGTSTAPFGPSPGSTNGQDSTFGSLTAKGGGFGANEGENGGPGGSGGGCGGPTSTTGGTGTQPQQPGDSGTYGFGNPGGRNDSGGGGDSRTSGGGGAGSAGQTYNQGGNGGQGKSYSISGSSVSYAGGGGKGGYQGQDSGGVGYDGGGNGGNRPDGSGINAQSGQANRGGGGGGGARSPSSGGAGGAGGSGIIIVSY